MLPAWLADTVTSDLDRALRYTLLWGLEGIELRTVGGPADRVPFVNEAKLKRRLAETEMLPASIVPGLFEHPVERRALWMNALASFGETLRFCARLGCPRIVVSAFAASEEDERPADEAVRALQRAGEAAAPHGIVLAVLNEYGMARPTGQALARLLAAVDHPAVRAAWKPADALRAGERPADGLQALEGRVEMVRCSDGFVAEKGWVECLPGEGAVDWPEQLHLLQERGFKGPVSLEVQLEPRATNGLRAATALIGMLRTLRRTA